MGIGRRQFANPASDLVDLWILVSVAVARHVADRIDVVRVEEGLTETWAIERAVVGVGLVGGGASGASMPPPILC